MMKKMVGAFLLFCLISIPNHASAHPSGTSCFTGSELYGYVVDCNNHQATKTITYSAGSLDTTYYNYVVNGASKWSGTVTFSALTTAPQGSITKYTDTNTSIVASFYDYYSNSSGHLTTWKIELNASIMNGRTAAKNEITLAHELGHAIGLNDLTTSPNNNKLMYGFSTTTATGPTTEDIKGAKEATK